MTRIECEQEDLLFFSMVRLGVKGDASPELLSEESADCWALPPLPEPVMLGTATRDLGASMLPGVEGV